MNTRASSFYCTTIWLQLLHLWQHIVWTLHTVAAVTAVTKSRKAGPQLWLHLLPKGQGDSSDRRNQGKVVKRWLNRVAHMASHQATITLNLIKHWTYWKPQLMVAKWSASSIAKNNNEYIRPPCVNGDIAIQWEWSNFDPSQNQNSLTDYDKLCTIDYVHEMNK